MLYKRHENIDKSSDACISISTLYWVEQFVKKAHHLIYQTEVRETEYNDFKSTMSLYLA